MSQSTQCLGSLVRLAMFVYSNAIFSYIAETKNIEWMASLEMHNLRKTITSENEELITEAYRIIDLHVEWSSSVHRDGCEEKEYVGKLGVEHTALGKLRP